MVAQPTLFDPPPAAQPARRRTSPRHVTESDQRRLSAQCDLILSELRRSPQSNTRLAAIALKYTSRISDLRAAGFTIDCERVGDGVTRYTLTGEPRP